MKNTIRQIVRDELRLQQQITERRKILTSVCVPRIDYVGWPYLPPSISSIEEIVSGIQFVERKLREEFGDCV